MGLLLGGALVLLGCARTWAVAVPRSGELVLPPRELAGSALLPLAPALGVVLLAGAVAVLALRGPARRAVGVLLDLAGLAVVVATGAYAADPGAAVARAVTEGSDAVVVSTTAWWVVTLAGGALAAAAASLVVVFGGSWPGMGGRFDRPGTAAAPAGPPTAAQAWDALDRGEDPTA